MKNAAKPNNAKKKRGYGSVKAKIGIKAIYDLSATPFFLRGSGYPEGTLYPWVVSDFSLVEVSGESRKDKAAKVATARTLWVPAVNQHGGFGRWNFIEISAPWDAENTIRGFLKGEISTKNEPLFKNKS